MFRRRVAALTVTCLAVTGCSGLSGPAQNQNPGSRLDVWVREPPDAGGDLVKAIGTAFTKRTGIAVKTVSIPEGFETKLQQAAAQHDLPDIVINDSDQLGTFVEQGLVREVDRPGVDRQITISDQTWDAAKAHNGTYFAVPFSSQSQAFLIRRDWRERLRRPVPRTWEDIEALARAFTANDPDGNRKNDTHGIEAPLSSKRGYASWYFATYLWSWGGDFLREVRPGRFRPAVATPASEAAFARFRNLACKDKVFQPGAANADTTAALESFQAGKTGIYLTGPYVMARIDQRLGADKYEVVAPPKGTGRPVTLAEGENIYLMSGSANQSGQVKYAVFAAGAAAQRIGLGVGAAKPVVRLPVNGDVNAAAIRKDPRWDVFDKAYAAGGRYFARVPNWTPIRQATAETVNAVVADCRLNLRDQLRKLDQRLVRELQAQRVYS